MRGLHMVAVHKTWGIALGFEVEVAPGNVFVGPGIAYDCRGREIVSASTFAVDVPVLSPGSKAAGGWFDLVIRYNDLDAREGGCFGTPSAQERPVWAWYFAGAMTETDPPLADAVRLGEDLPLARFGISATGQVVRLDFRFRRHAQGLVRPHIASGEVAAQLDFGDDLLASVQVDTSAGGFSRTPFYFASLAEYPELEISGDERFDDPEVAVALRRKLMRILLGPFVSIASPARMGFQLDVRFAMAVQTAPAGSSGGSSPGLSSGGGSSGGGLSGDGFVGTQFTRGPGSFIDPSSFMVNLPPSRIDLSAPVTVHWIGIEPVEGCMPAVEPEAAVSLSAVPQQFDEGLIQTVQFRSGTFFFSVTDVSL